MNIISYLESKGIEVVRDDGGEVACFCPFHTNASTPAFYINKHTGLWTCFNPTCGKHGSLKDLMAHYGDKKIVREYEVDEIEELLKFSDDEKEDTSWGDVLESIQLDYDTDIHKISYLLDRGFTKETLKYFEVSFSEKKNRIVIPVRDHHFKVVGFVGRTTNEDVIPKYLNSKGLPKKTILFNLNNAKKYDVGIVTEGPLDAMKVHQAGFPNVVASFGANITERQIALLREYFQKIIVFSDNDIAGFSMRRNIISMAGDIDVEYIVYPDDGIYADKPPKDPGDLTDSAMLRAVTDARDALSDLISFE